MTKPTRIYKHSSAGTDWAGQTLFLGLDRTNCRVIRSLGSIDMKKVRGRFRMLTMSKRISSFIALVIAFVSVGLSPAYAVDQRVIDAVSYTHLTLPTKRIV